MSASGESSTRPPTRGGFAATRWSVVLAAGMSDSDVSLDALETLCRAYWQPIYAYVRRIGHGPDDARDLVQEFFVQIIAKNSVAGADPRQGRFRSYLLGALKHFLADYHDRVTAGKRGGGKETLSLDAASSESSYDWEPVDERTPETLYHRRWALALMARAYERLEEECGLAGKGVLFSTLREFLSEGAARMSYPVAAAELGLTEANVRMIVSRLRRRYGEIIRSEVSETVGSPEDTRDELRHLLRVLQDR